VLPPGQRAGSFVAGLSGRAGGLATALVTTILAFAIGGLVVLATGSNPIFVYKGIFQGAGLNWFGDWSTDAFASEAAFNLSQTLLTTGTLILTGLAVAFAFRCGLFNIGGQGQFIVGTIVATWVGVSFVEWNSFLHILVAIVLASLAGAVWAGIAGLLKATVGAHEVISTIMLNWIAIWTGSYLFGQGGPLQNTFDPSVPISDDIAEGAKLPVWWGEKDLQGLHIGFFVALAALVAFWLILSRTTLGYQVRAVGYNPEAARYGGINVARSYFLAMAISGLFAGLAGGLEILGYQYRLGVLDIQLSDVGFIGIAVALLGRNSPIGILFSAFLFAILLYGTSTRSIDPEVFPPELAGNLTLMIQALVLLFVGADVLVIYFWRKLRRAAGATGSPPTSAEAEA
jgi:simple sugar transport system permease protein